MQKTLFNLPQIKTVTKQQNKELVSKSKPRQSKTVTTGTTITASRTTSKNKYAKKVEMIIATLRGKMGDLSRWQMIRTEEELKKYIDTAYLNGKIAIDTETAGLDPIEDFLVGVCIKTPGLKGAYIPIWHTDLNDNRLPDQLDYEVVAEQMKRVAEIKTGFHNAKFDIRVIKNWLGFWIDPYWCTLIGGNLLNENEPHGLKPMWSKYVAKDEPEALKFGELFGDTPFNYIPLDIALPYAAHDPEMTEDMVNFQEQFLTPETPFVIEKGLNDVAHVFRDLEMPLIKVVAEMEEEGIGIDKEKADALSHEYTEKLQSTMLRVQNEIAKLDMTKLSPEKRSKLNNPVNIGSPTQMSIVFYDLLGMKGKGTGADVVDELLEKYPENSSILKGLIEYRTYDKLLGTYINKMPAIVKEKTGRLHGQFNQYGAKTGRFSSSDPNLQNIPSRNKEIRKMIIPRKGHVFLGGDYSQQEPRVLAHLSFVLFGDNRMRQAYIDGLDMYSWIASEVYKVPYEECKEFRPDGTVNSEGKKRRNSCKSIVLGLMYGRSTGSIAEQLGISTKEAQEIVDMLFKTFPAIKQVVDYFQNMAIQQGFVHTVWGRKRRLPDIALPEFEFEIKDKTQPPLDEPTRRMFYNQMKNCWGNAEKRKVRSQLEAQGIKVVDNGGKIADAERQCLNSVIQGSGADITKEAMKRIGRDPELKRLDYKLVLSVHDEVIGQVPRENALRAKKRMLELMLGAAEEKVQVPMSVDVEITERWYGNDITHELEKEAVAF